MKLTKIRLKNFTAFKELDLELSEGINVFVGANATGKTHLMKLMYASCDITNTKVALTEKLIRDFLPSGRAISRLAKRQRGNSSCHVEIFRGNHRIRASINNRGAKITNADEWNKNPIESVYIPVKEMLSNAPGFRSLFSGFELHFEEIYNDIIDRATRPLRRRSDPEREKLMKNLRKIINGRVVFKNNDEFLLQNKQGNLEFTLLAEGLRKLGLLWLLIQNGTLTKGSVLFWDEPETNLNPKLFGPLMEIILELQRTGVQVFMATHDYVILKELDLKMRKDDNIQFHSLFKDSETGEISCRSVKSYLEIDPNAIAEAFADLYDQEIQRTLENK